jgi:hypothetical protein
MWGDREYERHGIHDSEVLVVLCDIDEKPFLIAMSGGSLFTTPHYDHGAVLVRLLDVGRDEQTDYLEESYLLKCSTHSSQETRPASRRLIFRPDVERPPLEVTPWSYVRLFRTAGREAGPPPTESDTVGRWPALWLSTPRSTSSCRTRSRVSHGHPDLLRRSASESHEAQP